MLCLPTQRPRRLDARDEPLSWRDEKGDVAKLADEDEMQARLQALRKEIADAKLDW